MTATWIWRELWTRDPARAAAFYGMLFGWEHVADGDHGQLVQGEHPIATLRQTTAGDPPNQWVLYAGIDDVPGATTAAVQLGGKTFDEPADHPAGRVASVVRDPHGALFGLMEGEAWSTVSGHGHPIWQELHTPNAAQARRFYAAMFGWNFSKMPLPGTADYHMASGDSGDAAGLLGASDIERPAAWLPYFAVASVDVATRTVGTAGGSIAFGPEEIPGVGRMALVVDSCGAVFALLG